MDHPVHGVNVIAQQFPRKVFMVEDAEDSAPPLVTVCNDATDKSVATKLIATAWPALMLWGESAVDAKAPPRGYQIAKDLLICAAFVTSDKADNMTSVRDCGYIIRAARIACKRYNSQDNSAGYRELNGIKVHEISTTIEHRVSVAQGTQKMWGYLEIHATAVETYS